MKKFVCLVLAMAVVLSLGVCSFAASGDSEEPVVEQDDPIVIGASSESSSATESAATTETANPNTGAVVSFAPVVALIAGAGAIVLSKKKK